MTLWRIFQDSVGNPESVTKGFIQNARDTSTVSLGTHYRPPQSPHLTFQDPSTQS